MYHAYQTYRLYDNGTQERNSEPTQKDMYHVYQAYRVLRRFTETDNNRLIMTETKRIQCMLSISRSKAYAMVKQLNGELAEAGYITIPGKLPYRYFQKKIYGLDDADQTDLRQIV